jgi:probable addiction module antidote protein
MKKLLNNKHCRDYHEYLIKSLKNPEAACAYLNAALEDEDPQAFLMALRNVVEARTGGIAEVSKRSHLNRESLYRMLSKKGNPQFKSLQAVLHTLGMPLSVQLPDQH